MNDHRGPYWRSEDRYREKVKRWAQDLQETEQEGPRETTELKITFSFFGTL